MRTLIRLSPIALAVLSAACFNLQVRDANFNGPAPQLGIEESKKLPLRVAVVVPDPMGVRYYYTPPPSAAGGAKRMDQTDMMRGAKSWAVEMARLSGQAFPTAFEYAAVLRQPPAPGEYDAVVELSLTSIDQVIPNIGTGFTAFDNKMWVDWKVVVYDKANVELAAKTGQVEPRIFKVKPGFSAEGMIRGIEETGGPLMSSAVREAALVAYDALAKKKK